MSKVTFWLSLPLVFLSFWIPVSHAVNVTIFNNCSTTIWPARYNSVTAGAGGLGGITGWEAAPQSSQTIDFPVGWMGILWARQDCNDIGQCKTGTCNAGQGLSCGRTPNLPVTEIEIAFHEKEVYFDISLLDGFNLPVSVVPSSASCSVASCPYDINADCPSDSQAIKSDGGDVLACWRASDGSVSLYREKCPNAFIEEIDYQAQFNCTDAQATYTVNFCPNGNSRSATHSSSTASIAAPTQTSSTPTPPPLRNSTRLSGGAIAGIVVGTIAILAIVLAAVFLCIRKNHQNVKKSSGEQTVEPFVETPDGHDKTVEAKLHEDGLPPSWHVTPFTGGIAEKRADEKAANHSTTDVAESNSAAQTLTSQLGPADTPGVTPSQAAPAVDIQRLFEDRAFEGELLNFLAQRMDPHRSRVGEDEDEFDLGSVAPPPTYREEHRA